MGLCVCSQKTAAFWGNDTRFNVQKKKEQSFTSQQKNSLETPVLTTKRPYYMSAKWLQQQALWGLRVWGQTCSDGQLARLYWTLEESYLPQYLPRRTSTLGPTQAKDDSHQRGRKTERASQREGASSPQMVQRTWEA